MMVSYRTTVVFLCLLAFAVGARRRRPKDPCPSGWTPHCNNDNKCVMPMPERYRDCLKWGGIPGVIACIEQNVDSAVQESNRMCIKDLQSSFGFARNLKAAVQKLIQDEEEEENEEEDDEFGDVDETEGDLN